MINIYIYSIYQAILGPSFRAFEFDSSFLLCIFGMSHPPQLSFHRAIMLDSYACMLGFPTQWIISYGNFQFCRRCLLVGEARKAQAPSVAPRGPNIHQLSTKKSINAMQWQQMSAQWAAMMQVSGWLKSEA